MFNNLLLLLQSLIFDEVDLSDASVAETSTKNINNGFTVSTHSFTVIAVNLTEFFHTFTDKTHSFTECTQLYRDYRALQNMHNFTEYTQLYYEYA